MYTAVILGAGGIAESHIKACLDGNYVKIHALSDVNTQRAYDVQKKYNLDAGVYSDYQIMIQEIKPDIAIICLPHFLHYPSTVFCIENGCSVLLEKPMAMNTMECDQIIELCKKNNSKLMVGHVIHYYPETLIAHKMLKSGELGELLMVNDYRSGAYFTDDRPGWFIDKKLSGGGMLMNLGAHSFDRIMWITGKDVSDIEAFISGNYPGKSVEGYARVNLKLEGNIPVTITVYGYEEYYKNMTELFFEGGVVEARYGEGTWVHKNGKSQKIEETFEEPFKMQLMEFIDYIEGRRDNPISGEYGRRVIDCIEKSYRMNGIG